MPPFAKGTPKPEGSGRKLGQLNYLTQDVRTGIALAAYKVGGVARLVDWIMESPQNEFAFWTGIWPRLAPVQVQGSGPGGEIELNINVELKREELIKKLEERGLPISVFGMDKPVLELEAVKGNGREREAQTSGNGDATRPNRRVASR
jgi:hypothetical protein